MHLLPGFLPALKRRLLTVPFGRALLEVMIVQVVVIVVYLLAGKRFGILSTDSGSAIGELAAFYCLCTLFWLALRWQLRPQKRSRWRQVMTEAAMSGLLFFELIVSTSVLLAHPRRNLAGCLSRDRAHRAGNCLCLPPVSRLSPFIPLLEPSAQHTSALVSDARASDDRGHRCGRD